MSESLHIDIVELICIMSFGYVGIEKLLKLLFFMSLLTFPLILSLSTLFTTLLTIIWRFTFHFTIIVVSKTWFHWIFITKYFIFQLIFFFLLNANEVISLRSWSLLAKRSFAAQKSSFSLLLLDNLQPIYGLSSILLLLIDLIIVIILFLTLPGLRFANIFQILRALSSLFLFILIVQKHH